jgi:hypothetical protein
MQFARGPSPFPTSERFGIAVSYRQSCTDEPCEIQNEFDPPIADTNRSQPPQFYTGEVFFFIQREIQNKSDFDSLETVILKFSDVESSEFSSRPARLVRKRSL